MTILKNVDKYFWVMLLTSIFLGFYLPTPFLIFEPYIIYIVMFIIGFLFLKVDIVDIVTHIKNPFLLLYVSAVNLIITPAIAYLTFRYIAPELTPGLVFLAALPSGVTSAAFTDIMKGRTSLTLTIIIITNLLSILTIPFVFYILFNHSMDINIAELMLNLLKVFAIPFFIAKVLKHVLMKELTSRLQDYYNIIIITLFSLMLTVSISYASEDLLSSLQSSLSTLGYLFLAFIIFQIVGYFSVFWMKKGEKLAISNSNMLTNSILGIVLALAFLTTEILNLVILSLIPWSVMVIAKHWYKRFLP